MLICALSVFIVLYMVEGTTFSPKGSPIAGHKMHEARRMLKEQSIAIVAKAQSVVEDISLNPLEICICGALATAFGDLTLHPIDTIKTVQQAATTPLSAVSAAKQILKKGGIPGLYQGVVPYLLGDGLSGAVKFAAFEASKKWVEERIPEKYHGVAQFVCAAGAFVVCSVILVPGEVLKCRIQAGTVASLGEGVTSVFKTDGFLGFYQGYGATLLRDVPYTMLELGLYENIKLFMKKRANTSELGQRDEITAGAITGTITGLLTTPLDVVKTKMMLGVAGSAMGIVEAFSSTYANGGMDALFAGAPARVAWLLPFTTIYLQAYELLKKSIVAGKSS